MNKRNYPAEIEEQSVAIARVNERLADAREHMEEIVDAVTRVVLAETDPETGKARHSNDKARELAIRERCRASEEWRRLAGIIQEAEFNRAEATARLERLRGEFSLSKIERRERIAHIEAAIN